MKKSSKLMQKKSNNRGSTKPTTDHDTEKRMGSVKFASEEKIPEKKTVMISETVRNERVRNNVSAWNNVEVLQKTSGNKFSTWGSSLWPPNGQSS